MSNDSHRFSGQTVIVTGAGAGIGRATVERLLSEGARVIAVDALEERLAHLPAATDDRIAAVAADITDPAAAARILDAAGPRIDGLANIAGIMDGFEPTAEIDDATWDRVLAVNLTGMMRLTRAVLPGMVERGRGSIVNVGSEAGQRGSAAGTPYTTSKHAVNGFTLHRGGVGHRSDLCLAAGGHHRRRGVDLERRAHPPAADPRGCAGHRGGRREIARRF